MDFSEEPRWEADRLLPVSASLFRTPAVLVYRVLPDSTRQITQKRPFHDICGEMAALSSVDFLGWPTTNGGHCSVFSPFGFQQQADFGYDERWSL